ncbi:AcrR family transcriptional regulator [Amycolatopsis lexingtonensis]|uniref:AcrR family transcriptional regulator n=1 Tax=Amycolatopsis lexingtonensis TaxID=218822 RepID=A0ABR9IFI9_9PSEU|nr:TetR/AcrR family transcriptional regulator [Amycolatopsis lexingtonensis]MBE1501943.1 AcrR family transcriptional regulator [Amycolatopsis lexingtonensis]
MSEQPGRKRDAAATRLALLDAAAKLFAERGFDRTTVRDIAKLAGVNQSLLFRYFGSKEALFEAVIARNGREQLATTPPERLFSASLRSMLAPDGAGNRTLETYLRSSGSDGVAAAIRQEIGEEYARVLATLTDAPDAELRADLALAWLMGIALVREISGKEPLASADPEEVCRLVLTATRTLLERSE